MAFSLYFLIENIKRLFFYYQPVTMTERIAILYHLGNISLVDDIDSYLVNLLSLKSVDIYISHEQHLPEQIKRRYPNAVYIRSERGMDIGGFLLSLAELRKQKTSYRYFPKVHTKTDPGWRKILLQRLCGSPAVIRNILALFNAYPNVNMIGAPEYLWLISEHNLNQDIQDSYCQRKGIPIDYSKHRFVAGTMFWGRYSDLMQKIDTYQIKEMSPGYTSNNVPTLIHAFERLFGVILNTSLASDTRLIGIPDRAFSLKTVTETVPIPKPPYDDYDIADPLPIKKDILPLATVLAKTLSAANLIVDSRPKLPKNLVALPEYLEQRKLRTIKIPKALPVPIGIPEGLPIIAEKQIPTVPLVTPIGLGSKVLAPTGYRPVNYVSFPRISRRN